jgi:hypothetical protein
LGRRVHPLHCDKVIDDGYGDGGDDECGYGTRLPPPLERSPPPLLVKSSCTRAARSEVMLKTFKKTKQNNEFTMLFLK